MNAANEEAVHAFIDEGIALTDIPRVIESVMSRHQTRPATDLEAVLDADRTARAAAGSIIESLSRETPASSAALFLIPPVLSLFYPPPRATSNRFLDIIV